MSSATNGDFVVAWRSYGSFGTDSDVASIQGQRYASDGSPQGGQFQVNTYTTDRQLFLSVSSASNGGFVVVWDSYRSSGTDNSYGIHGQRFASDGSPEGGQFQVNTYTTGIQEFPFVSSAPNGDFVVAWTSWGADGIQAQRFASDGSPTGGEFQVNTYTTATQRWPAVSSAANGDFVVAWNGYGSFGTDSSIGSIQAQRFASTSPAVPSLGVLGMAMLWCLVGIAGYRRLRKSETGS